MILLVRNIKKTIKFSHVINKSSWNTWVFRESPTRRSRVILSRWLCRGINMSSLVINSFRATIIYNYKIRNSYKLGQELNLMKLYLSLTTWVNTIPPGVESSIPLANMVGWSIVRLFPTPIPAIHWISKLVSWRSKILPRGLVSLSASKILSLSP